jgi:hypothetical protein
VGVFFVLLISEIEVWAADIDPSLRDRFLQEEVWRTLGLPVAECLELTRNSPPMQQFRRLLVARIVPNVKRLGLLTPFLRERFRELDILQFEDAPADA